MYENRSFEQCFGSLGVAISICTLTVSIGKLLTPYYLFYSLFFSVIIITSLTLYQHHQYQLQFSRDKNTFSDRDLTEDHSFWSINIKKSNKRHSKMKSKKLPTGNSCRDVITKKQKGIHRRIVQALSTDTNEYMSSSERSAGKFHRQWYQRKRAATSPSIQEASIILGGL